MPQPNATRLVVTPLLVLRERAEARAYLFHNGFYETYQEAIGPLIVYAERHKIKGAIAVIDAAFKV